MTQFRKADLTRALTDWANTGRYLPPRSIAASDAAKAAELEALAGVLLKHAPLSDYAGWVIAVFDLLESNLTARQWPTKGQLEAVCRVMPKPKPTVMEGTAGFQETDATINARRIASGQAVGEPYLFGVRAHEVLRTGICSMAELESYRKAALNRRKALYGPESANSWYEGALRHHEAVAPLPATSRGMA